VSSQAGQAASEGPAGEGWVTGVVTAAGRGDPELLRDGISEGRRRSTSPKTDRPAGPPFSVMSVPVGLPRLVLADPRGSASRPSPAPYRDAMREPPFLV